MAGSSSGARAYYPGTPSIDRYIRALISGSVDPPSLPANSPKAQQHERQHRPSGRGAAAGRGTTTGASIAYAILGSFALRINIADELARAAVHAALAQVARRRLRVHRRMGVTRRHAARYARIENLIHGVIKPKRMPELVRRGVLNVRRHAVVTGYAHWTWRRVYKRELEASRAAGRLAVQLNIGVENVPGISIIRSSRQRDCTGGMLPAIVLVATRVAGVTWIVRRHEGWVTRPLSKQHAVDVGAW